MENITMDDLEFYRLKGTGVELCLNLKGTWDNVFVAIRVIGKIYYLNSKDTKLEVVDNGENVSDIPYPNKPLFACIAAMPYESLLFEKINLKTNCTLYRKVKNKFNLPDSQPNEKAAK